MVVLGKTEVAPRPVEKKRTKEKQLSVLRNGQSELFLKLAFSYLYSSSR